jgi:hypothetical protein
MGEAGEPLLEVDDAFEEVHKFGGGRDWEAQLR